jgi:hypothetical protein
VLNNQKQLKDVVRAGLDHRFGLARAFFSARQELATLKQLAGLPKTPWRGLIGTRVWPKR